MSGADARGRDRVRLPARSLAVAFATATLATTAVVATPAHAAPAPKCRVTDVIGVLGTAAGGCDGYGGPGHDRLVVQCRGYRGTIINMPGRWMHRYQSWWYRVYCPGGYGYRASSAWIEHVNW